MEKVKIRSLDQKPKSDSAQVLSQNQYSNIKTTESDDLLTRELETGLELK